MKEVWNFIVIVSGFFTIIALVGFGFGCIGDIYNKKEAESDEKICLNPIKRINRFISKVADSLEEIKKKEKSIRIGTWIVLAVGLFHLIGPLLISKPEIGAYFEMLEYKAQYYVHAYPGYYEEVKSYRLPADIWKFKDGGGRTGYWVGKVYFPNGGYADFEYDDAAIVGEKVGMLDSSGEHWYIELTKDKVK